LADLFWRFGDGLRFGVITDPNEVTAIWRHRLHRKGGPNDRESLREERKAQQNAEGECFHIAVSLCIICAMESPDSAGSA
jgi:hypothetical protein